MSLQEDLLQQRAQLSHLYEQQEAVNNNIKGLKQIIATLEYAVQKEQNPEDTQLETENG